MMSSDNKPKHIYKYDENREKVIIIDSETGEEIERRDDQLSNLLNYVNDQGKSSILRKFAIWCARQPDQDWKPIVYKMFRTVEEYLHGDITKQELTDLYNETEGIAISTDSVGLQHGDLKAPLLLAARASLHPDSLQAAREAARYHKLWAEMKYKYNNQELSEEDAEEVNQTLLDKITRAQIDRLLDLLNQDHTPDIS